MGRISYPFFLCGKFSQNFRTARLLSNSFSAVSFSFPQVTGDAGGFPEALHESFFFMEDNFVANDELRRVVEVTKAQYLDVESLLGC